MKNSNPSPAYALAYCPCCGVSLQAIARFIGEGKLNWELKDYMERKAAKPKTEQEVIHSTAAAATEFVNGGGRKKRKQGKRVPTETIDQILALRQNTPPMTYREIAQETGVHPATIAGIVKRKGGRRVKK